MDFREEYKKSEKLISPTDEQIQRMMSGVMSRIESGEADTKELNITPNKKAFPFKRIAYIGGSIAACAAITIAAVNIVPTLGKVQTAGTAENAANYAADATQNTQLTTGASTTIYFEANIAEEAADTQDFDNIADISGKSFEEEQSANTIAPTLPNINKENPGAAEPAAADEPDYAPENEFDAEEIIVETSEISVDYYDTTESTTPESVDEVISTCEPCEEDFRGNPETGADPDLIAAWQQAVEDSPLVCIEDFDSSFEKPLTKLEFTSIDGENDTLIIGDKTYKLTNHEEEDEWTFTWFSMSSEEIAALPYEYFTTGRFNEFQHIYKIFFAEDRCFVVYLLGDAASFANPQGEYVLVE